MTTAVVPPPVQGLAGAAADFQALAAVEEAVVDYAGELRAERDIFREWALALMAKVYELTRATSRQADEIARLRAVVRGDTAALTRRRDGRAA